LQYDSTYGQLHDNLYEQINPYFPHVKPSGGGHLSLNFLQPTTNYTYSKQEIILRTLSKLVGGTFAQYYDYIRPYSIESPNSAKKQYHQYFPRETTFPESLPRFFKLLPTSLLKSNEFHKIRKQLLKKQLLYDAPWYGMQLTIQHHALPSSPCNNHSNNSLSYEDYEVQIGWKVMFVGFPNHLP